jgi:MFS family permease
VSQVAIHGVSVSLPHERIIRSNFKRNFTANVADVAFWSVGAACASTASVLPLYLLHLTTNPVLIGLIPAIQFLGWRLPQLFTANLTDQMRRKLPFVLWVSLNERLPLLFLGLFMLLWRGQNPQMTLVIVFALLCWQAVGGGLIATPWQEYIAKIILPHRWGLFFGTGNALGALVGVGGAALSAYLLSHFIFPRGFAYSYLVAFVFAMLSFAALTFTVEPAVEPSKPRISFSAYFRRLPAVLRADGNFRNYLLVRSFATFCTMGSGFMAVHAVEKFHMGDSAAGIFTAVMLTSTAVLNPILGHYGDRLSHKLILTVSFWMQTVAMVIAALAPNSLIFMAALALRAGADAAGMSSGMTIIFEFCDAQDRPTYIGLGNTLTAPPVVIAPLIGGVLAASVGYQPVFWISAALGLASVFAWQRFVADPRLRRGAPAGDADIAASEAAGPADLAPNSP